MPRPTDPIPQHDDDDRLCVGVISGTSADGIDAALVRIARSGDALRLDLLGVVSPPYPADIRAELLALPEQTDRAVAPLCSLHAIVGELFAEAVLAACRAGGVAPVALYVVGSHGQSDWRSRASRRTIRRDQITHGKDPGVDPRQRTR